MSMPNIPDVKPDIDIDRDQSIDLLIASVAFEELGLAHLVNAEAEKIQFVLGTLKESTHEPIEKPTLDELLQVNKSVEKMMKRVIEQEILLDFKLEDAIELIKIAPEEDPEKDPEIKELSVSYTPPTYTGSGHNRVGSTTVTLTFTLTDDSEIQMPEILFSNINTTTSKDFNYIVGTQCVTVHVTVTVEGENNSMYITGVTADYNYC